MECGVNVEKPKKRISGKYCVAGGIILNNILNNILKNILKNSI